jgi:hypothetical protein
VKPINGDDISLHYGDEIIPLSERLDRQDREIRYLKRYLLLGAIFLFTHSVLPAEAILPFLLRLIGL